MPIRPENRARYPADWPEIARAVKERANWRCEGLPPYESCRAEHGKPHPVTGSIVVLTAAHLNHKPEDCRPQNLKAACQRCHLTYDRFEHAKNRRQNAFKERAVGDLFKGDQS